MIYLMFTVDLDMNGLQLFFMSAILIWSLRLGVFLFWRVLKTGHDRRFDEIKRQPILFIRAFLLSITWVMISIIPGTLGFLSALDVVTKGTYRSYGIWTGIILFGIGFLFETIADYQKQQFRSNPKHRNRFISSGLWSISRHPNYFGEICLHIGFIIHVRF